MLAGPGESTALETIVSSRQIEVDPKTQKEPRMSNALHCGVQSEGGAGTPQGGRAGTCDAKRHEEHPVQVSQWKKEVGDRLPEVFAKPLD